MNVPPSLEQVKQAIYDQDPESNDGEVCAKSLAGYFACEREAMSAMLDELEDAGFIMPTGMLNEDDEPWYGRIIARMTISSDGVVTSIDASSTIHASRQGTDLSAYE